MRSRLALCLWIAVTEVALLFRSKWDQNQKNEARMMAMEVPIGFFRRRWLRKLG